MARRMSFGVRVMPDAPVRDDGSALNVVALVVLAVFAGIGFHAVARAAAQAMGWVA